jgi:hypothetical protein
MSEWCLGWSAELILAGRVGLTAGHQGVELLDERRRELSFLLHHGEEPVDSRLLVADDSGDEVR